MADSTTNLDLIDTASAQKETTANAMFDAASPAMFGGREAKTCVGLTFGGYGGKYNNAGVISMLANWTQALNANQTSYIEFDFVTGFVSSNNSGFTAGRIPLYKAITGPSTVTSYTDYRFWGCPANPRQTVSVAGSANVILTQAQDASQIIELTGAITANIQVVIPLAPGQQTFYNNTSGAFTVTVIGSSGTGIVVGQGKHAILETNGTNVLRVTPDT